MLKKPFLTFFLLLVASCQAAPAPILTPVLPTQAATPAPAASPTPSPSPSPTSLPPTALPRFFTEEFNGELPGWPVLQSNRDSPPRLQVQAGALSIELEDSFQWAYAILGSQDYAGARLDALVQSRGTAPEAIGLICRYSQTDGWYEFNISSDGTYTVLFGQWLAQGIATYLPIASDRSEYLKTGGAQNEIGLACQEDILWLYLNGKLFRKLDVERFGLEHGQLGLAAASFENVPVTALFEWVKVSQP